MKEFDELYELVKYLRSEKGCPWDRQQTSNSIAFDLIEEAYEINDAIECDEREKILEELGDLLFLILMHIRIKEEEGVFTLQQVLKRVREKMISRHPHVFGEKSSALSDVLENWEKSKENPFDTIPNSLPALLMGQKIVEKVKRLNKGSDCRSILNRTIEKAELSAPQEIKKIMETLIDYTCQGKNPEKDLRNYLIKLKKLLSDKYLKSNKNS
ncbi:MAG: MazG nucleotide pyrophosphohydrolase domain-containing protein [bacterium]|nr:MazG nucleotide pyrophosphohydrolase domain-containing protein [bacterium]